MRKILKLGTRNYPEHYIIRLVLGYWYLANGDRNYYLI